MKHSLRLYSCTFCHTQVLICSNCDRGQIYCASTCALTARKKSCKQANRRYQKTFKGKMNNALRQRRFRQRSKKIVTDCWRRTKSAGIWRSYMSKLNTAC